MLSILIVVIISVVVALVISLNNKVFKRDTQAQAQNNKKTYTLSEMLELPLKTEVILTPENYREILKFAEIANKNKDVEINMYTQCVDPKFLDSLAFYGVKVSVLTKYTKSNGVFCYLIACYNALRKEESK